MSDLYRMIDEAASAVRARCELVPEVAIILGTGLGAFAGHVEVEADIPYGEIPHFLESTVQSHAGRLVLGTAGGRPVITMDGRFHFYEGHSMQEITLPVRIARALGAKVLVVSNACGGLNPQYRSGDIMIIEDHINLMGANPLIGPNDEELGPRFPDMCEPYARRLVDLAEQVAIESDMRVHTGVYVAVAGPNLETRAEYRFLRTIGADVVGMSTVPEVLVAVHAGMEVLGLSCVTDMCLPDALTPANIDEIVAVANAAEPKLTSIATQVIQKM